MSSMQNMLLGVSFLSFLGSFCLWHAWRDTDWFFENAKAAFWVSLLGRSGARWFYAILGSFILILALVSALSHL